MKFIAISDVHLGKNLYNRPELGEDLQRLFTRACDLAIKHKVDYLFVVGDLFESNKPTPDLIQLVQSEASRLRNANVILAGIAGDHDKPINGEAWVKVSGLASIDTPPFLGFDYSDNPESIVNSITAKASPDIHWLFLHAMAPSLWPFCEDKKKIDFAALNIFQLYPNLKGVILGDIHDAIEGRLAEGTHEAFIGYCGSLGITKSDEVNKRGILYYDGKELTRLPFPMPRHFVKLDLDGYDGVNELCAKYANAPIENKPVFLVEAENKKDKLTILQSLESIAYVEFRKKKVEGRTVSAKALREELNNTERMSLVIKELCNTQETQHLLYQLLTTDDPKVILDKFKKEHL